MNRPALAILLLVTGAGLISCGSSSSGTNQPPPPGSVKLRAFISNPLFPNGTATAAVLNVVDALNDVQSSVVSVGSSSPTPGMMVLFPNKRFTLVFSASNNAITVVNNATQSVAQNSAGTPAAITLPGYSESMVVAPDNVTGFAAVPNAPVTGQSPGAVDALDLSTDAISAAVPVPGARYLVQSHNGNRILVMGSRSDTVTVLAPSSIGTSTDPRTDVQSSLFDHPVWGAFSSDDSTAYIVNCGPECGGTTASITLLDMNSNLPGPVIPVDSGTTGLLSGNTLYVAGTEPGANTCAASAAPTLATTCGEVSAVDLGSMTVTASATITDGYHNHMEMGANQQLFIGAHACTNINVPASGNNSGETRGCLSIFNISKSSVVIPPVLGDVTGIQPISRRNVVYVVQNGELNIYDTTTDKLQTTQIDIIGQGVDVKQVD
ncbi:MAG: YncE family protein [Terriglobales bacterium]